MMQASVFLGVVLLVCYAYAQGSNNVPIPPADLQSQTYNWPQSPLPNTPGIMPQYNVPIPDTATNLVDLTFGTDIEGATVTSVAELGNVAYFYDLFGDPSNVRTSPVDGIPGNFLGVYSFYEEYMEDNVTRNPLAVHQILSDRLRLVARTAMNGSDPGAAYEIGYIRLPFQFLPGMMAEIRLAPGGWPTCRWSWPTFWAFTAVQLQAEPGNLTRYYATEALENDGYDGYPMDNSTQGISMSNGCPIYGPANDYGPPSDQCESTTGDFQYWSNWDDRFSLSDDVIPTNPNNPGLTVIMEWTDVNTTKYWVNGQLIRVHNVHCPSVYNTKVWDGAPPPDNLLGQTLPMFLMVSHQFGVQFNPIDKAALLAYDGPIVANYDVMSIRIWDSPSTQDTCS